MTNQTKEQIEELKSNLEGNEIEKFYYEEDGDYFVIEMENGEEFYFRFMNDLVKNG